MVYAKPEIAVQASSLRAVQGTPKGTALADTGGQLPSDHVISVGAYEAGE